MHRLIYLRDKEKYGNQQDWTVNINEVIVKCYARRSDITNAWCGYVEIGDKKVDIDTLDVHGGITGGSTTSVGFDCAHCDDWTSGPDTSAESITAHDMIRQITNPDGHYWTFPEVKDETERLAKQIY